MRACVCVRVCPCLCVCVCVCLYVCMCLRQKINSYQYSIKLYLGVYVPLH